MTEDGRTASERYLDGLCRRTFLRLWSYSHVYRNQLAGTPEGKEVCDLLVVCDPHIVIFSDKQCGFPNTGNVKLDWSRWFGRAIQKSAKQVRGAERWIRDHPDRLFVDRECSRTIPLSLPCKDRATFHLVVVAHGSGDRCRAELGGSGSLQIMPGIVGESHYKPVDSVHPFSVGRLSDKRTFVHVVDDFSLDTLLKTLDTVSDLTRYLLERQHLVQSGRLASAAGEEELLAFYLRNVDATRQHAFVLPEKCSHVTIAEGLWEKLKNNPQYRAKLRADKVSYSWDELIEKLSRSLLDDKQYFRPASGISDVEIGLRLLARENRVERRVLARALLEVVGRRGCEDRVARVVPPLNRGRPHYVFLTLRPRRNRSYEEYRKVRLELLKAYCRAVKVKWPAAEHVVGIATEPMDISSCRSEDFVYMDPRLWDEKMQKKTEALMEQLDILRNLKHTECHEREYPKVK